MSGSEGAGIRANLALRGQCRRSVTRAGHAGRAMCGSGSRSSVREDCLGTGGIPPEIPIRGKRSRPARARTELPAAAITDGPFPGPPKGFRYVAQVANRPHYSALAPTLGPLWCVRPPRPGSLVHAEPEKPLSPDGHGCCFHRHCSAFGAATDDRTRNAGRDEKNWDRHRDRGALVHRHGTSRAGWRWGREGIQPGDIGVDRHPCRVFLVRELVDGPRLRSWLGRSNTIRNSHRRQILLYKARLGPC